MKARSGGDCFENAFNYMFSRQETRPTFTNEDGVQVQPEVMTRLCHGRPTLQTHPHMPFIHAWIEITIVPGQVMPMQTMCVDVTHGWKAGQEVFVGPRKVYYEAGQIKDDETHRYTLEEARRAVVKHGHFGPWHKVPDGTLYSDDDNKIYLSRWGDEDEEFDVEESNDDCPDCS
jgi:hypothetical protein